MHWLLIRSRFKNNQLSKLFSGINMHVPNKKNLKPNFWFFFTCLNHRWVIDVHLLSISYGFFLHINEVFLNYVQNQNLINNFLESLLNSFLFIFKLKYVLSLPFGKKKTISWENINLVIKGTFKLKVNKYEVWF